MRWRGVLVALVVLVVPAAVGCSGGDDDTNASDGAGSERTTTTAPLHADDDLADGRHFGFVTALDPAQQRLVFDPAELLRGEEAAAAAEADGEVVTEGGNYVRNPDDRMNRITMRPDLEVRLLKPCCELREVPFEEWLAGFIPDERSFYGTAASHYWITIEDGEVVAVDEQYIP